MQLLTYEEFNNGINYLFKNGLVKEVSKRIFVENIFVEWFENKYKNKKRIYALRAVERVQKYLDKIQETNNYIEDVKTEFIKDDFENSVEEYLKMYEAIK